MEIINYHNLPCLLIDDAEAVVFSYVKNKFVCVKTKRSQLFSDDFYSVLSNNDFFKWVEIGNIEHEDKQLTLSLTEQCNCNCKYCFLDANTHGAIMSIDTLHSAISYAFKLYTGHKVVVNAFGGEPSTQEHLVREMVAFSNSIKEEFNVTPRFAITTNGVLNDRFIDFLIENDFDCSISIDGVEDVQNKQRPLANGNPTYDQVIYSLKRLVEARLFVRIRATITKYSVNRMVDAVRLFGKIGVEQIHFEPVTLAGRAVDLPDELLPPPLDEYVEQLLLCIQEAKIYGSHINFSIFSHCNGSIKNKMIVGASGMISSCVEVQSEKHFLSDLFGMGRFDNDGHALITKASVEGTPLGITPDILEKCKNCMYLLFCANSCPVRNYRATGNIWHTEPFKCNLYHKIMPSILYEFYKATYLTT